ncbi:MAG TPA: agmatine deiminase family protein [Polyangiaceae bacterium]|jgi:agmatine deiminase
MPAEWAPHAATWVAWPSHEDLWQDNLAAARRAFVQLALAVSSGETTHVLVPDEANESLARTALASASDVRFHRIPFGDIWLRDTAPLFLTNAHGAAATVRFAFNGWGGKYVLDHDDQVAERIAADAGLPSYARSFVLEGGAVDVDGEGSVLTTRQCMLNPNRNGRVDAARVEEELRAALGVDAVLWLGTGLLHDHTDGHVDTIVRFVRPGVVVAMEPRAGDDPNRDVLRELLRDAAALRDARGRKLEVVRIPSPGRVLDAEDRVMPASYVNFYLTNTSVVVPTYGTPWDDEAVERVGALFPERKPVGVDARAILTGGGAFHCITQQQPQALP